ncbi:Xaa-Pro aminopeptidase [bacterium]|nr:Xaa-Pro aminopeptidase [bacterium]
MITQKEYQARRLQLAMRLPSGCMAVIPAANELIRNGDAHFRFRQDSDFYYLTGFNEPDALLLISSGAKSESILFNRPNDALHEQWNGKRLGQDDACRILGVDAAYALDSLDERLPEFFAGKQAIAYSIGCSKLWDQRIVQAWQVVKGQLRRGINAPDAFYDLAPIVSEMRLFKSEAEIDLMRQAARISTAAHQRAMRAVRHVTYEYELEAELLYEFTRQGCRSVAYDTIVAGGENACILHYTENNQLLKPGSLVLIDAGGEFEGYAADITRTFPVNGQFNTEQRLIYNLVLKAQQAGMACIRPGCIWDEVQQTIVHVLTLGLVELGLLRGNVDVLIKEEAYKPFYMHNSGHWLGLDVHDCGRYKIDGKWRPLKSGMVLTVEPGLYVKAGLEGVDERWWNIGVRIEDDIRVTDEGYENLSVDLAVEIDDIEALVRG